MNAGFILLFIVLVSILSGIQANAVVEYNDSNTIYSKRTKEEVAKKYSEKRALGKTYENDNDDTYYKVPASTKNPYNAGVLTDDTLKTMQGMTDFYRWLVGVNELKTNCKQSPTLQAQALDRNFQFDHYIDNSSKPADMPDSIWKAGFECTHNILALGTSPRDSITNWLNEGYRLNSGAWGTVGHRYALLSPNYTNISFGYSGQVAVGKVDTIDDSANYKENFSAYPAPGYMPSESVQAGACAWSVDLKTTVLKVSDKNKVSVKVTNDTTKKSYTCKVSDDTANITTGRILFKQPSDSENNTYTANYTVKITGLYDVKTKKEAALTYHVKFFNVTEYVDTYVQSVKCRGFDRLIIYETMDDTDSLRKIGGILCDTITVVTEAGRKAEIPVNGTWVLDKTNQCYTNSADESKLPSGITDKNGVLKNIKIPYKISDDYYDNYNVFYVSNLVPKEHQSGYMRIHKTRLNYQHSNIVRIYESANNTYSGTIKYDSALSPEYDKERSSNENDYYTINSYNVSDSGVYLAVYYSDSDYYNDGYVSTSINELKVSHDFELDIYPPSCTEGGSTIYTCKICGLEFESDFVAPLGHNYEKTVVDPTCTERGYTIFKCTVCGDSYKNFFNEALGHKYKETVKAATCTESGYTTHTCERCNDTYKDSYTKPLGHNYKEYITEPNCTEEGYTLHRCALCGDEYKNNYKNPLGHSFEDTIKAPSCTEEGYTLHKCSRCDYKYSDTYTKPLGHIYDTTVVPPSCTDKGYTLYECEVCGEKHKDDYVNALGHIFEYDGIVLEKCDRCNAENPIYADKTAVTSKKANPIKVTAKTKTVKVKKLKKKTQKIKALTVKNAKGKVTYKLIKKGTSKKIYKKLSITKKGVLKIKKGKLKKGTYKIKLSVKAKGNKLYNKKTVTKTFKIKVK
jgi:hypothetical protein